MFKFLNFGKKELAPEIKKTSALKEYISLFEENPEKNYKKMMNIKLR